MNKNTRFSIASAVATIVACMPFFASALTVDELQAQIKALMTQLQGLQQQLHSQVASTTPIDGTRSKGEGHPCVALGRTLAQGMQGDDVRQLQEKLISDGDLDASSSPTGFFGPATLQAVHKMQKRFGIASTTGLVGPQTREFLKKGCADVMQHMMPASSTPMMRLPSDEGRMHPMPATSTLPLREREEGQKGQGNRPPEQGALMGSITALSADAVTIKDMKGSTRSLAITSTTAIRLWSASTTGMVTGSISDLLVGDAVMVNGAKQPDGSATAILIQKGLPLPGRPGAVGPGFMRGGDNY